MLARELRGDGASIKDLGDLVDGANTVDSWDSVKRSPDCGVGINSRDAEDPISYASSLDRWNSTVDDDDVIFLFTACGAAASGAGTMVSGLLS